MSTSWTCSVEDLAKITGGKILAAPVKTFARVGTDSRADLSGRLFVPLKGDKHDAHNFVAQAISHNAAVVLVDSWRDEWKSLATSTLPRPQR